MTPRPRRRALGDAAFLKQAERVAAPQEASLLATVNAAVDIGDYDYNRGILAAFSYLALSGRYLVSTRIEHARVASGSPLAPKTAKLVHRYQGKRHLGSADADRMELHTGRDYILYAHLGAKHDASIHIAATTQTALNRVQAAVAKVLEFEELATSKLEAEFWYRGMHEYERDRKQLDRLDWADISRNYPAKPRWQLAQLTQTKPEDIKGRLILLYGLPGVGKTHFLRCLGTEWADWCRLVNVLDPDVMFRETEALITVMRGSWQENEEDERWRLIVLEDAGELIAEDAKRTNGHDFSRLLNAVDGMLAAGQRTLFVITTNEDVTRLHPAVSRPGRCLARIEIPAMTPSEAFQWYGSPLPEPRPYTLAELITLRDGGEIPAGEPMAPTGAML